MPAIEHLGKVASLSDDPTGPAAEPDISDLLRDLNWSDDITDVEGCYSAEDLPKIVRIAETDEATSPAQVNVDKPFLLHSGRRCSKVLAANVYWDDSTQAYVDVGPRVVIPVDFNGWFWFLQDFARVGKTFSTVSEVVKAQPARFLVRRAVPAFTFSQEQNESGERVFVSEFVSAGQVLTFGDIFTETVSSSVSSCCLTSLVSKKFFQRSEEKSYLQCKDGENKEVLLEFTQEGEFVATGDPTTALEDSVYKLKDIVQHVQLPVLIKLAFGQPPSTPCSFTGLLKLEESYNEEAIIGCSLGTRCPTMAEFPRDSKIRFHVAKNSKEFLNHDEVSRALKHCDENIQSYITSMKVVQTLYSEIKKNAMKAGDIKVKRLDRDAQSDHESLNTMTTGDFTDDDFDDDEDYDDDTLQSCDEGTLTSVTRQPRSEYHKEGLTYPEYNKYTEESNYEVINEGTTVYRPVFQTNGNTPNHHSSLYNYNQTKTPTVNHSGIILEVTNLHNLDSNLLRKHLKVSDVDEKPSVHQYEECSPYIPHEQETNVDDVIEIYNQSPDTDEHMNAFLADSVNSVGQLNIELIDDISALIAPPPPPVVDEAEGEVDDFLTKVIESTTLKRRTCPALLNVSAARPTPLRFSVPNSDLPAFHDNLAFSPHSEDPPEQPAYATVNSFNRNVFKPIRPGSAASSSCRSDQQIPLSPGSSQPTRSTPSPDREMLEMLAQRTDSGIFIPRYSDTWPDSDSPYRSPSDDVTWSPPDNVSSMSVIDVLRSLRYIGMKPHVISRFQDEQIDGKQLLELDDTLLREGFPELNALERKKIRDFIAGWRPKKL